MTDYGNYIAGEWTKGTDAGPNVNPSNVDDVIGHYAKADKHQAEAAIAAANRLCVRQGQGGWRTRTMKRKKSAAKTTRRQGEPRELMAALAGKRFTDQTRRMLGTHYANRYGVRRGR